MRDHIAYAVVMLIFTAFATYTISTSSINRKDMQVVNRQLDSLQGLIDSYESYYDYPFDLLIADYKRMDRAMNEGMNWCDALQFLPRNERFKWSEGCIETVYEDHMVLFDGTPFYFLLNIRDNELN